MRVLLVGPRGHGGEEVYVKSLPANPPAGVEYELAGDFHHGARGATCNVVAELALNRLVHPVTMPDMGFRALHVGRGFDLVHVHAHPAQLTGLRGRPVVMSEGSSAIIYLQQYLGWNEDDLVEAVGRTRRIYRLLGIRDRLLALERVSRAYVFSEWARAFQIRWGADPAKLDVIYPGFETPQPPAREAGEEFSFLFVGRDFERKGGFELIEAFDAVLAHFSEARLIIAGSDPAGRNPDRLVHSWVEPARRERLLGRLAELEAAGAVELMPWLDRAVLLNHVYPRADAFVMPPHAEGFGFTNVEAMSFGLPVITSTVGPAAEIVRPEQDGLLVAPGDPAALATAMLRLLTDRVAARRMGEGARQSFLDRFTLDRFRSDLREFYARALRA